ncbi:MAG TPA: type I secretion system permease/ATPase [Candidatus Megaira endosymbiont of Hartmannula sinica]|nr:type I secretion system permease/ATPase [Candidatus Megaera endosymbiont of Hartmannula sinica]
MVDAKKIDVVENKEDTNIKKEIIDSIEKSDNPLKEALDICRSAFKIVFWFAFAINLLMLVTPIYSLQVLDRVLGSGNKYTLLMLSLIIASVYFAYALLQIARSFTLIRVGNWLDKKLSPILFGHAIAAAADNKSSSSTQLLRDFQTLKNFLTSIGINTLFDAPWSIVYIIVVFMIHPYIGIITVCGAVIIVSFAFFNAVATNRTIGEANEQSIKSMRQAEIANRNAETVVAMGMIDNVRYNWSKFNNAALKKQSVASYRNGIITNFSRFVRNIIQMSVTGTGAYIVITTMGTMNQEMTPGSMIASSIIVGRALAPFDNAIAMWKTISDALKAYKNINQSFEAFKQRKEAMPIPEIDGNIIVDNIYYAAPKLMANTGQKTMETLINQQANHIPKYIIKGISFTLYPSTLMAIIGSSGAGKSTLAKLLVGVWKTESGSIRIDGGDVFKWNRKNFGEHVGYLPQTIELFSGSIRNNIARMDSEADPAKVIEAAKMCDAHEMILRFPDGYETDIGPGGSNLSGGQRQRIGLARAFYGKPKIVVLDEPNANLDEVGERALASALKSAKKKGISVIIISHRQSILSAVDKIMVVDNGSVSAFGDKDEIINRSKINN